MSGGCGAGAAEAPGAEGVHRGHALQDVRHQRPCLRGLRRTGANPPSPSLNCTFSPSPRNPLSHLPHLSIPPNVPLRVSPLPDLFATDPPPNCHLSPVCVDLPSYKIYPPAFLSFLPIFLNTQHNASLGCVAQPPLPSRPTPFLPVHLPQPSLPPPLPYAHFPRPHSFLILSLHSSLPLRLSLLLTVFLVCRDLI